jgi:glycosyltransferase involved in cell wall biosynthesis
MRVIHLIPFYKPAWKLGGPVRSVGLLCEGLSDLGVEVEVITTNAAGGHDRLDVAPGSSRIVDGVRVTYLPYRGPSRYYFTPRLSSLIRGRIAECDIVHATGVFSFFNIAVANSLRRTRIPFVVSPRGSFMPNAMRRNIVKHLKKALYTRVIERRVIGKAAAVHCTTPMELRAVRRLFPKVSAFVVPNGIDTAEFDALPRPGTVRERLRIPETDYVFLYLGRLHRHKGLDLSIRALSEVAGKGLEVTLIVAGAAEEGSDKQWRDLAERMKFAHRCRFVGQLNERDKLQYLADADALILNSHSENFGISVAEALVSGLPVLVSDQVGIADWVSENRAGMVVPQEVPLIADAARTMVVNREAFRTAMNSVRGAARSEFGRRACARRMLDQYRSVIETGGLLEPATAGGSENPSTCDPQTISEGRSDP